MIIEEIDLNRLKHNYLSIEEQTKKQVIPVIKSDGYGLGAVEISSALNELGVKLVAVNDVYEAITLKEHNFLFNILIMNSIELNDYTYLYKYPSLILTINSVDDITNLNEYCYLKQIRVHLQVDTGMSRLGIKSLNEYQEILDVIQYNNKFVLDGIYTHYTSVENYLFQEKKFKKFIDLFAPPLIHTAASSTYQFPTLGNAIRIGLDLYGDGSKENIKQVITIKVNPIAINVLEKGQTVGYNEKYKAEEKQRIAVLPIGYNDGYKRQLNDFYVVSNNKKYNIIGTICMNHLFVSIDDTVTLNSEFELISDNIPIIEIANHLHTIPGDIMCGLKIKNKIYKKE